MKNKQPLYEKGKGGIVPGGNYYDHLYKMNHNELLLNKKQQELLFEEIKKGAFKQSIREHNNYVIGRKNYNWHVYKPIVYFIIIFIILMLLINYA